MLDNFEMAFKTISDDPKIKNYQTGFKMIYRQLTSALTEEGVEVIEPKVGDEFDHSTMAAMSTVPGEEDNKVSSIYLKGYKLKDRLVRPAMVIVTKVEEKNKKTVKKLLKIKENNYYGKRSNLRYRLRYHKFSRILYARGWRC